jgi:Ca-activated chloride channel family protein
VATVKYGKFTGIDWDALDLQDLLNQLADFLLQSGFGSRWMEWEWEEGRGREGMTLQDLHDAILEALLNSGKLPQSLVDRILNGEEPYEGSELQRILNQLIQRLNREGYVSFPDTEGPTWDLEGLGLGGKVGPQMGEVRFELTEKSLDFLGYKTLKDLLGSLGKSSFGRHDTRDMATGVEASGAARPYEFGDLLNLDVTETLANAIRRDGLRVPIDLTYGDLMVRQAEYQSSCATVLLLDTSHSMILYGEDRFTPAKKVAMALAHLIRTQYPGDSLRVVLFHDSAEEIPLRTLARTQVGPYYTNTREGLRLAQRLLERERKDMRQIIMITDGKPSALTQGDGRIYKNAFGLDPVVVRETIKEVARCRKSGILINTFMLARDYDLVGFVKKVTEICRGKAYFTTPYTLGQYVLMDYMAKKTRTIH